MAKSWPTDLPRLFGHSRPLFYTTSTIICYLQTNDFLSLFVFRQKNLPFLLRIEPGMAPMKSAFVAVNETHRVFYTCLRFCAIDLKISFLALAIASKKSKTVSETRTKWLQFGTVSETWGLAVKWQSHKLFIIKYDSTVVMARSLWPVWLFL